MGVDLGILQSMMHNAIALHLTHKEGVGQAIASILRAVSTNVTTTVYWE